ncbi:TIGR02679 family protein [Streptomyces sp. TR06-5]|uniref:TIGR02679 family protein n=1 Tax=unclassified Streptomyces TaxID=2593676 RepID=UPI0039A290B6
MELNPSSPPSSPSSSAERPSAARPPGECGASSATEAAEQPGTPQAEAGVDTERLQRLLGDPGLAWLLDRLRRRLAQGRGLTGTVTLAQPDACQRRAAERLLGRAPGAGTSLTVRLEAVDAVLRHSGVSPHGLQAALHALAGPVVPRAEIREREAQAWEEALEPLSALGAELGDWAERMRRDGLVRRLARTPEAAGPLVTATVQALRLLPLVPPMPRSAFAARYLAGAHALDEGTPLATLVLSGIRALTDFPEGAGAEWRRAAWAAGGLLRDDVSSTVLTLNLRGTPALDWMADEGEPAVVTLRALTRHDVGAITAPAGAVHVCENPAVLSAAADSLGPACPPLVCLQGQPSAAALTLLRALSAQGADVLYHGDFDWGGMHIATTLRRGVPWQPWRYSAVDYGAAVARAREPQGLTGTPVPTPWDPMLSAALAEYGVRVEEESVIDDLLLDLEERAR